MSATDRKRLVESFAQRLLACEQARNALTRELEACAQECARVRALLENDETSAPAARVRAAHKRLRKSTQALVALNEHVLRDGLARLTASLSVLALEQHSLRDDLLERYYELARVQSPRFEANVFAYGGDEIPSSAATTSVASVASVFLPLSTASSGAAAASAGVPRKRKSAERG
jgi:hypothetical protein